MHRAAYACVIGIAVSLTASSGAPAASPAAAEPSTVAAWWESVKTAASASAGAVVDAVKGDPSTPGPYVGVRWLMPASADSSPAWSIDDPARAVPGRVVLLVHGLDEPGPIFDELAPALQRAGYAVARFDYPNDGPIAASADHLIAALADLRSRGVGSIDIVGHSMGGLVARDALTRPGVDRAALPLIDRFITVGTPNSGSAWAHLQFIAEAREVMSRWIRTGAHPTLADLKKDGNGEAATDLLPGSAFLTELNARPLPERTRITIIAGRVINPDHDAIEQIARSPTLTRLLGAERGQRVSSGLIELASAAGDGVVPLDSTPLAGVEDVVVLDATHRALIHRVGAESAVRRWAGQDPSASAAGPTPPAIPVILDRLSR